MSERPVVSSLPALLYSALLGGLLFAGMFSVFHYNEVELTQPVKIALTSSVIFFTVFMTIKIYKRMCGILKFTAAFLSGWASALVLGLLVILYQIFFYKVMLKADYPDNFWVPTLVIHNIIGAMVSCILALIMRTKLKS